MQKKLFLIGIAGMLALAVACGGDKKNPASPSSSGAVGTDAGADGSTLKISAPAPISPNNAVTDSRKAVLVARHATGTFVTVTDLTYRFQVVNGAGTEVYNVGKVPPGSADRSTHTMTTDLAYATDYRWRAQAEQGDLFGPWSGYASFRTPNEPQPPAQVSPADGATVSSLTPDLVITNPTTPLPGSGTTVYRFVVERSGDGGGVLDTTTAAGVSTTFFTIPTGLLQAETSYRWRSRAEMGSTVGLWSPYWTFSAPRSAGTLASYQNSTELWDNLADGKTIGTAYNVQMIRGKGAKMVGFSSHLTYTLQSTLTSGAVDFMIEGLDVDTNGGKTKVMSMQEGYSDITDNAYRFNVEKRGDDHPDSGKFRMRIITGNALTGFYDSDRLQATSLSGSKSYVFHVTWGSGILGLTINEGSARGPTVLNHRMSYQGTYRPNPHVVHIGAPVPRGGEVDATVPGIIVSYFYVSPGLPWPGVNIASFLGLQEPWK